MPTPRKTRAPRKYSPFRMSAVVSCTLSTSMHTALLAADPKNKSKTIRTALSMYAHAAKPIKVPDEYRPPKDFNQQVSVSLVLKPEALRQEYEHHASVRGIPMSELILRCLYAYLFRNVEAKHTAK
jgi:hypothetical protein